MHNKNRDINFGKVADKYDRAGAGMLEKFYRSLLEQVELSPGMSVLDVGCGTGTILRRMADTCAINGFGIDMSENMIGEAKQKCPDLNIQISRCEDTPFEDNTFDVVTTCLAYHHFSDRAGFAKEVARIMKPGGCLYIADPYFPFVIRKTMNAIFHVFRVAGAFFTPDEIYEDFTVYGFEANGFVKEKLAQVVKLKLSDTHGGVSI